MEGHGKIALFAASFPLVFALVATPAGGASLPTDASDDVARVQSDDEALFSDFQLIAASHGWTVSEAAARHRNAAALGQLAESVYAADPEGFIGSALPQALNGDSTVFVRHDPPTEVRQLIESAGVILDDDFPMGAAEAVDAQEVIHKRLLGRGYQNLASHMSLDTGRIELQVGTGTPSQLTDPLLGSQLLALLPENLRSLTDIEMQSEDVAEEESGAWGGMRLRYNTSNRCTSGFSVRNPAGVTGITGAGHCSSINRVVHGSTTHTLTYVTGHQGSWGDVEWYTSAESEPDDFYADASTIRDVTAVEPAANISVNEDVCGYGRSSNTRYCTTVRTLNRSCTDGVTVSRIVGVAADGLVGGDSGGPWSTGTVAFGGHYGDCGGGDAFSVASYFDEAINASVRTS